MNHKRGVLSLLSILLILGWALMLISPANAATQIDIVGPAGSQSFGSSVTVLPNGNFVVTDPYYNGVGAVYLYDGANGARISMLTGSTEGDGIGYGGVMVLTNGNYVVSSPYWQYGGAVNAGAVTWGNATTGVSGVVSPANSLVGSTYGDLVGSNNFGAEFEISVTALANGNYVVHSPLWDNGGAVDTGAVTWGDGTTGVSGVVGLANSLVGSTAGDRVGSFWDQISVTPLANGNYVVSSPLWDNGGAVDAGAVTWGDGTTGVSGVVGPANSLVGSTAYDGSKEAAPPLSVTALSNGNYMVSTPYWDNSGAVDAGAVTWGDGKVGITGTIREANSLVGSTAGDQVGSGGITALSNGNYVVRSPGWNNGAYNSAGAVTWGDGMTGITGTISVTNSLVSSASYGSVGSGGVTELANGNYVITSPNWANFTGAVTWGDGTTGITGTVSATNSLVGSTTGDQVGVGGLTTLVNGNYVVRSPQWNNGGDTGVGAVTWGDGGAGITGTVGTDNSLVGSTDEDQIGSGGVTALTNGAYVVHSPLWNNGAVVDTGAVTWGDGMTGITGTISVTNSLVGSTAGDQVSYGGVLALTNGNYIVCSPFWNNGAVVDTGAVTWGDGVAGITGTISPANSLVGSTAYDQVGFHGVTTLVNGSYVVPSPYWDNGTAVDAGAVTWGDGTSGITGTVSSANSLVGSTAYDRVGMEGVNALANGNYVVPNPQWDNGTAVDAGAVTWGNGTTGVSGVVSSANSLVGSTDGDQVGNVNWGLPGVYVLSNGNYVVRSPDWDNEGVIDAGAVSLGDGNTGTTGYVTAENSVHGTSEGSGEYMKFAYDHINQQLVVGRPSDNIVTLYRPLVADAGPDQTVKSGASVTLDGSASYDPYGYLPLAFDWEQSGGTSVSLNGSDTANPTFIAPTVLETSTLTFTLVVSNSLGVLSLPDEVVITVEPYEALLPLVLNQE